MSKDSLIRDSAARLRGSLRDLVVADLAYKFLAFVVLTPLFSILFRGLLLLRGNAVLSDVDIARFFLGPVGLCCAILLGAVWLGIASLGQASLLAILAARAEGKRLHAFDSLRFAASHAVSVVRVTGRIIAWSLLVLVPCLLIAGAVYFWMLGEYDINYYLDEQPLEFKLAVGIGLVLVLSLAGILLRWYSGWILALPLVIFDQVSPKAALSKSNQLVSGHRRQAAIWIVGWMACYFVLNLLVAIVIGAVGSLLIPSAVGSLALLTFRIGLMLLLLSIASLVLHVMGTVGVSLILFHAYRKWNPSEAGAIHQSNLRDADETRFRLKFTRARLLMYGAAGLLGAMLVGLLAVKSLRLEDHTLVMAHRGASYSAPENTLAAIRQAIDAQADWVEIDVQETADDEVVVMHDSDFMKLSRNNLKIWNATLADLREIDIGTWFDPKFASERVPTLAEVLELCRGKIGVIIELKYYGHDRQLEQRVVDLVERHGMARQVMVMSLKPAGVKKVKTLRPQWKCGLLLSASVGNIERIEADFLAVNARLATRTFVQRLHRAGKEVYVWTINDPASMSLMMSRGVDGILTDRPELAREVLASRAGMSSSERLLGEIASLLGAEPAPAEQ